MEEVELTAAHLYILQIFLALHACTEDGLPEEVEYLDTVNVYAAPGIEANWESYLSNRQQRKAWIITELHYENGGSRVIRKTSKGRSWNERDVVKETHGDVSWKKRRYRLQQLPTDGATFQKYTMVEYTPYEDKPQYALCRITTAGDNLEQHRDYDLQNLREKLLMLASDYPIGMIRKVQHVIKELSRIEVASQKKRGTAAPMRKIRKRPCNKLEVNSVKRKRLTFSEGQGLDKERCDEFELLRSQNEYNSLFDNCTDENVAQHYQITSDNATMESCERHPLEEQLFSLPLKRTNSRNGISDGQTYKDLEDIPLEETTEWVDDQIFEQNVDPQETTNLPDKAELMDYNSYHCGSFQNVNDPGPSPSNYATTEPGIINSIPSEIPLDINPDDANALFDAAILDDNSLKEYIDVLNGMGA